MKIKKKISQQQIVNIDSVNVIAWKAIANDAPHANTLSACSRENYAVPCSNRNSNIIV